MSEADIFSFLAQKIPFVGSLLMILGSVVVLMSIVVGLTPTKKDDAVLQQIEDQPILGKIWDALKNFSVIQKK